MPKVVYAALILLSLIWGGSFYFVKVLVEDFGSWGVSFLRSAFGLVAVTAIMLSMRKPFGLGGVRWPAMAFVAIVNTALPWFLIAHSETRLDSGVASILNATTPIWTIVIGVAAFRASSNRYQWLGIAVAFLGVALLLGVTPSAVSSIDAAGLLLMLSATLCYGLGSQLSKRVLTGYSMYQLTFGTLLCSTVASGIMALVAEPFPIERLTDGTNLLMLLGLGVFGSGVGYILFYYIILAASAEFATMVTYLVPCTALVWAYTLLGEHIGWNMLAGLVVILGGVYLAGRKRQALPAQPAAKA
ncbi:DMT family transporter [Cohnella sp. GbtcB17]|uniref:DMT family transporter n=1 Tax=Cohnella sp. GbtcB17 TaxID=2824762 RepID=UPI001C30B037|nr:DMT family transporter [Cohnella sp. GbtcB17]